MTTSLKPFAPGELVARVQAVLRRAGRAAGDPRIEAEGHVRALAAHRVTLDGEEVHLTPIEFSLLRTLALNRGVADDASCKAADQGMWGARVC